MVTREIARLVDLVGGGDLEEEDALASLRREDRAVFLEALRAAIAESEPPGMFAEPPPVARVRRPRYRRG